ncbi:hypothetical protein JXD38_02165, partial [candidate division WOR-3 bacterium]|nr:hypothetical protein [candidate division WOR-3 bacterium]
KLARDTEAGIRSAFKRLGTPLIAVRSSGTAEDLPGHSFAGLYDTYLRSTNANGCVELVKQCWASLWTERAFDYRDKNGFPHDKAAMAVVVQQLVAADAAGVVFTADPVTGNAERIIVESCWGLGEALVSGKVTPDRFVIGRDNLKVAERVISKKSVQTAFSPTGTVVEQPLPPARAEQPSMSDAVARKIALLALRVERVFGTPQDVEWAMAGPNLFLLQSRPITTIAPPKSWEDRQVWSTTNAAEVLPGVLTPMVWSTVGEYVGKLLGGIVERIGISLGENPLFDNVAGRLYMNLNTFTGMVRLMPFAGRMSQAQMFGGQNLKPDDRAKLVLSDRGRRGQLGPSDVPDIKVSPVKTMLKLPGFLLWILHHGPVRGRAWITAARTAYEQKERPDLTRFSEAELVAKATATMEQMGVGGDGLGYALAGMMFTSVLYDLCRKWFKDQTGASAGRLLAGTSELQSAEAGIALWRLAREAAALPDIRVVLLSNAAWNEVRPQLEALPAGQEFLTRWDRFMHLHGHHTRGEMDMYNPRWREQPDYVLKVVRNFMRAEGKTDPESDQRRHAEERDRLKAKMLAVTSNPAKRWVFGYVVRQAQLSAAIRENVKDAGIRIIADTREVVLELGDRLASRGVLADADDIFFLRFPEVEPVVSGNAGFNVRTRIAERRAEYEKNLALSPPAIIVGRYNPDKHKPDTIEASAELKGLAVSPGVVTGPARVILHAGTEQVLPGEILVAPFTDPGWTPYFIPAAGIVMDQGGLLSHGSIVAREWGIPAVVNVGPATKLIKTGQMIQVDGDTGVVRLMTTPK